MSVTNKLGVVAQQNHSDLGRGQLGLATGFLNGAHWSTASYVASKMSGLHG